MIMSHSSIHAAERQHQYILTRKFTTRIPNKEKGDFTILNGFSHVQNNHCKPKERITFRTADRELIVLWIVLSISRPSLMFTPPICCQCRSDIFDGRAINWQLQKTTNQANKRTFRDIFYDIKIKKKRMNSKKIV